MQQSSCIGTTHVVNHDIFRPHPTPAPRIVPFSRYVALGDSSTEGLEDDLTPTGRHRGWADRLAEHVARAQTEPLLYANLAVRGRKMRHLVAEQLEPALAMEPDLVSVFAGTNDIIRSNFDLAAVLRDLAILLRAFRARGATVVTITMPDLSDVAPMARRIAPRLAAFNEGVRALCADTGTRLLDAAQHPVAVDRRLWHEDRLHANAEGHRRIAAGLAHVAGIPGFEHAWDEPLPPAPARGALTGIAGELHWAAKYLTPWILRRLLGRSSGDDVSPKRPTLAPVQL